MFRKLSRRVLAFVGATTLAVGATVALAASPAAAAVTVSGDVVCNNGSAVVGVWIQAAGGSGWATGTSVFSKSGVTVPWTVHVGCGGTPSNWQWSVYGNKSITSTFANWGCWPYATWHAAGCFTTVN